jgi:hypothetical protein
MKLSDFTRPLLALLAAAPAYAGPAAPQIETPAAPSSQWTVSHDLTLEEGYVGPAKTGGVNISEQSSSAQYVLTGQFKDGPPLRLGFNWDRFSFSSTAGSSIPNTLQSESLVVGVDLELFSSVLVRLEADPGFYSASARISGSTFDIPIIVGGTYLYSKDVQIALGISIDPQREYPVLPGGGIRWQINDHWLLDAILPKPRLEYVATRTITVYGGADIAENSYRADGNFGRFTGNPRLNGAWTDYDELRLGGGATVKLTGKIEMGLEFGYMAYREFNFFRADVDPHSNSAGLYGGITIEAKF